MDGYQATRVLRSNGIQVPIIAVTANALSGEKEKCLRLGMNAFVTKPIVKAQLLKELKSIEALARKL
ncbi:hypothetical protein HDU86_008353 [Geranomyces michiganensis]|nr:hypothetical protein HDU86_008353 [Geranomyces michiganensis]